jgi:hypothetical protein
VADRDCRERAELDRGRSGDRHRLRHENSDNTVSVFNGAICNAQDMSGCGQTPATVPVGSGPIGIFADHANHTVYVANFNDETVSIINSATCNATDLASCPTSAPPTITVAGGPGDVDANQRTHTVYVANLTGLSAFDANTCNATELWGCATIGEAAVPPCNAALFPWCGPFSGACAVSGGEVRTRTRRSSPPLLGIRAARPVRERARELKPL